MVNWTEAEAEIGKGKRKAQLNALRLALRDEIAGLKEEA